METVSAPKDFVEQVAGWRFTPETDARIQALMDRNNDGQLTPEERSELASLVSLNQQMTLMRARALLILGRKPT